MQIIPMFQDYKCAEDYTNNGVKAIEPMTAKEIETEEEQDRYLASSNYYVEEKFDGTRATLHFYKEPKFGMKNLSINEMLREDLMSGTMIVQGKLRVYNFFKSNNSLQERVQFLKGEYGQGVHSHSQGFVDYDTKGIAFNNYDSKSTKLFSWTEVAKEIETLINEGYYLPQEAYTRCFSRRVSEKTGWYCENTDSLPQLRDLNIPELEGTIIDGEMFIPFRPFKDVSATLNCNWEKAIARQQELGWIVFHAFDITHYKGICIESLPLAVRKEYLQRVVKAINSPYVELVKYYDKEVPIGITRDEIEYLNDCKDQYPVLFSEVKEELMRQGYPDDLRLKISHRAYYEFIVMNGGEGVILKPKGGKYFHKRGREYQKIKKFLTREVIIMGFTPPTKEYKGKYPKDWEYFEDGIAITKFYAMNWVGNIRYGVVITDEEIAKLPKNKKFNIEVMFTANLNTPNNKINVIEVGECSGFDEEQRLRFSCNAKDYDGTLLVANEEDIERYDLSYHSWIGKVIEVKANELFKDTGKMRHPRFLRERPDKSALQCTWKDHIS